MKCYTRSWTWRDSLEKSQERKLDMRFVTWNVKCLYKSGTSTQVQEKSKVSCWQLRKWSLLLVECHVLYSIKRLLV